MRSLKHVFMLVAVVFSFTFVPVANAGSSFSIPGVDGPNVTLANGAILVTAVFTNLELDAGIRYNIPKYPRSYVELSPDFFTAGTMMAISISLADINNGTIQQLPGQYLPGGRPIPGIMAGKLPAVAFTIPQFSNMTIYLGSGALGFFIPNDQLDYLNGGIYTIRYYRNNKPVGTLSLVGEDINGKNSGFLLLLNIKAVSSSK